MTTTMPVTYREAGVDSQRQEAAMPALSDWISRTFLFRDGSPNGRVRLPLGYFANVIELGDGPGLALSTDGVGTKILVAQLMGKYDTIGIDCVAMNANDVLCVGAEPLAMLDYIAVEVPHPDLLESLAKGLYEGARLANITIPGGEIAQVKEMVHGIRRDGYGFDLVGTCVGIVPLDRILVGNEIQDGDMIVGLHSSGVHSNGLTLARHVFFDILGWEPDRVVDDLGRSIGDELLEPTRIYVREVVAMLQANLRIKALAHITSKGFLNLSRAPVPFGYVIDNLPEPLPIFDLIQSCGGVPDEEMFFTYNMGIGFCIVVAPEDVNAVRSIADRHGVESAVIGHTIPDPERRVRIPSRRLVGSSDDEFHRE